APPRDGSRIVAWRERCAGLDAWGHRGFGQRRADCRLRHRVERLQRYRAARTTNLACFVGACGSEPMSTVLFAGPSIFGFDLRSTQDFSICPPAVCGDILKAVRGGARTIGLVDGLFGSERSVWHKEILVALSDGVRVLGASSMGALRAVECDQFGME